MGGDGDGVTAMATRAIIVLFLLPALRGLELQVLLPRAADVSSPFPERRRDDPRFWMVLSTWKFISNSG